MRSRWLLLFALALPAMAVEKLATDVHVETGLTCADCHGTRPRVKLKRADIPKTCGTCHGEQLSQYQAGAHGKRLAAGNDSVATCIDCHGVHDIRPAKVPSPMASKACGTCHAMMQELYDKSVHAKAFDSLQVGGCTGCHGSHEIAETSHAMLAGEKAVCNECHPAGTGPSKFGALLQSRMQSLADSIQRSAGILERARLAGMEVSDPLLKLNEVRQASVQAVVAVHSMKLEQVDVPVNAGIKAAQQLYAEGEEAMRERDRRRYGLGASLAAILLTMVGLWLWIRKVENPKNDSKLGDSL